MLPQAGGMYVYLREAYGRPVAFLFGWTEVIFGKPASTGALAVAFVGSLRLATAGAGDAVSGKGVGWMSPALLDVLLAVLLIAGLAWLNILGVLWGGRMQWLTTVVKAGFLAGVGLLPFALIPFLPGAVELSNYATTVAPRQAGLAQQLGAVLLAVMWAYNGWHGITPLAEEIRQPQRNIPLALLAGIGILMVLYVLANCAYHGVLSMDEMRAAGDHASEQMLNKLLGKWGLAAMSTVIMCSTFGAINSNLLQAPRVSFAMGRDGVFFRTLGQVHARYRTPAPAIVVMAAMAMLLVISVGLGKWQVRNWDAATLHEGLTRSILVGLQDGSIFSLLTNFVIFSASIFYMLAVLAVIVLRWRLPAAERPYRTAGYPVTPLLFLAVYVWFLGQIYRSYAVESRVGLLLIALGIPAYWAYGKWGRRSAADGQHW
jgi:APA family basic amino acid/polyamine antiporter